MLRLARSAALAAAPNSLRFLFVASALALNAITSVEPTHASPPPDDANAKRPNLLVLVVDDLRWNALGCEGDPIVRTPAIDALAARGARFANSFCTTSICATSRATILTGQYARRHGIHDFQSTLSAAAFAKTFPALLRAAGYRTGFVGKWGLGGPLPAREYDVFQGFAGQGRYYEEGRKEHLTRVLESQSLAFIDSATPDTPFCLQVSFKAAHCQDGDPWPFQPDRKYASLYADETVPPPPTAKDEIWARLPAFLRESEARRRWAVRFANPELRQKSVKDYYRLITGVDDALAAMLARLEARGLRDRTIVVFTADNGFYLGDRGLAGKWFPHEESIRVPLLIEDPRASRERRGVTIDRMALTIDLAPTLLDFAGVEVPRTMQGRSLTPLVRGEAPEWRTDWFYEHLFAHQSIPRSEAVRGERWKYFNYIDMPAPTGADGKALGESWEELYDLEHDPNELVDLARDPAHAVRLDAMRTRWKALREAAR